jgi:5'(3')-deoxyribonucleotidase
MFRDLDVIEGAAEVLWRLSDAGVWIRIITHRLYVNWGHQAAVSDTVEWLDAARIPYRDLCFLGAKPQVEADLYIDDSPGNVSALRRAGNEVIVFDQPYNQAMDAPRASTWNQIEDIVLDRFTKWSGVHGVQPTLPGVAEGGRLFGRRPAAEG